MRKQTNSSAFKALLFAVLAAGVLATSSANAREERTVDAIANWQGGGQVFQTGDDLATFVGAFAGTIFINKGEGGLNEGRITCPAIIDVDLSNGKMSGQGRCTISVQDGARVYAEWSCTGIHSVGCDGVFTLTGGTDRLANISGGGPISVRTGIQAIAAEPGNVIQASGGIAVWKGMRYVIP